MESKSDLKEYLRKISNLKKFDRSNIDSWFIYLDSCVMNALELFSSEEVPEIDFERFKLPLVCGSGNAFKTGEIIFSDKASFHATESTYSDLVDSVEDVVDSGIVISSSGKKNAGEISSKLKKKGLERVLFTCNPNALAKKSFDSENVFVFPKNPEPYTYNTSTYLGMILSRFYEDPVKVKQYLMNVIDPLLEKNQDLLKNASSYFFMIPDSFELAKGMFQIKFEELYGRKIARDFYTPSFVEKHATDIVPTKDELKIGLGCAGPGLTKEDLLIPMPKGAGFFSMVAIGYYVIGKIQRLKPNYFKNNIVSWCEKRGISPLVE